MVSKDFHETFSIEKIISLIIKEPNICTIWGDVGVGKSTFALQIAKNVLKTQNKKIFYLNTKEVENFNLISRIFELSIRFPEKEIDPDLNFYYFQKITVQQQLECISSWLLEIQQYQRLFGEINVGLIIIDEIFSNYLVELRKEQTNEKLNRKMVLIFAILKEIATKYSIPIILVNTFSVKLNKETNEHVATPHGGKILNFWIDTEIKISRSPILGVMTFEIIKSLSKNVNPKIWKWKLGNLGFH